MSQYADALNGTKRALALQKTTPLSLVVWTYLGSTYKEVGCLTMPDQNLFNKPPFEKKMRVPFSCVYSGWEED